MGLGRMEQKDWVRTGFAVLVTLILLWFLLQQIQMQDIMQVLSHVQLFFVLLAFLSYAVCYLFRAVRFRILLQQKLSLKALFGIVSLHNLFTSLLPFRTGELSYLYLTKRRGIPLPEGIASLLMARLFDFLTVSLVFFVSMPFLIEIPLALQRVLWMVGLFLLFVVIFITFLLWLGEPFLNFLKSIFFALQLHRIKLLNLFMKKLKEGILATEQLRSRKQLSNVFGTSLLIWIFQYFTYYSLIVAMGLPVSLLMVIVATSFISLASAIPLQGIAGFGVNETVWSIPYILLGLEQTLAISSGFVQHIIILVFYTILGLVGFMMTREKNK